MCLTLQILNRQAWPRQPQVATQLLRGVRQSLNGMPGAPSSEPVSSSKGDTGRYWLPEVCSSSMVSYLKLFLAFLMLRRRFVNATLRSRTECQTAKSITLSAWWSGGIISRPSVKGITKTYSCISIQANHCFSICRGILPLLLQVLVTILVRLLAFQSLSLCSHVSPCCPGQPPAGSSALLSRLMRRRASWSRLTLKALPRRPACPSLMWKASMAAAAALALAVLCSGTCCTQRGMFLSTGLAPQHSFQGATVTQKDGTSSSNMACTHTLTQLQPCCALWLS